MNINAIIFLFVMSLPALSHEYEVKENDSLSCLAESKVGLPVYGESGSLKLLLKVNDKKHESDPIVVGDVIKLPSSDKIKKFTSVKPENVSLNCFSKVVERSVSGNTCTAHKREAAGADVTMSVCNEICPHIHNNEGYAVSFLRSDKDEKKKEVEGKSKITERYVREVGVYQSSLVAVSRTDGTNAEWVSRENFYLKGGYQIFKNNWWYGFAVEYHLPSFEDVDSAVYTWDEDLPNLLKFSMTVDSSYKRFNYGFSLDYNQELFFTEELFEISLEEVFIFGMTTNLSYNYLNTQSYLSDFGVKLSYPYIGSADMDPEGEFSYLLYLNLTKASFLDKFDMTLSAFYGEKNFMTNRFDQVEEYIGFSLTLRDMVNL